MGDLSKIINNLKEYWGNISAKGKKVIIFVGSGLLVLAIVLTIILNRKDYIVLYENVNSEESVEIITILQSEGIEYKYENNGTISIPEEKEDIIRMQLSQMGYPKSGTNYDVFTDNIDFMSTSYEKRQFELYQLQERMQDSIKTIDGIEDAIVTISLPDDTGFAVDKDKKEPTASIKLVLKQGSKLEQSQSDGILNLVSKSIAGLKEENIAIIDTDGNSLKAESNKATTAMFKKDLEEEYSEQSKSNILGVLSSIYGSQNVRVSVNTDINLDKTISEILEYMPDEETKKGTPSSERNKTSINGEGTVTGDVAGTEANAEIPTYSGYEIDGEDINVNEEKAVDYLVSQLKEQTEYYPGTVESVTVAVVINKEDMSLDEINKVKEVVAFAEGIEEENVSVQNFGFFDVPVEVKEEPEETFLESIGTVPLIIAAVVIGIIALVAIEVVKVKMAKNKEKELGDELISGDGADLVEDEETEDSNGVELPEQKIDKLIRDFADNDPEMAAKIIRTIFREDEQYEHNKFNK